MDIADDDIDIDNRVKDLLTRGLDRYGEGDLEGALAHWKHAMILDPENEKAAQYASYVEDNHDLAELGSNEGPNHEAELDYPFGIEELGLAKLRDDELDEDYESLVVEDGKKKSPPAKKEVAKKAAAKADPDAGLDDGWDVDEGWVSDLVEKSETAFAAVTEEEAAKASTKEEAAEEEPAEDDGFGDFELASADANRTALVAKPPVEASETPTKEIKHEALEEAILGADAAEDEDEDEDDEAYAEMEIGVASDELDLGFAEESKEKGQPDTAESDSEASFGDLDLSSETDFGDVKADDEGKVDEKSLPETPIELGSPGRSKRDSGGASSRVSEVINAIEVGIPDELDLGSAGPSKSKPKSGSSDFTANESGDIDLPDETSDDEVLAKIESQAPSGDTNERVKFVVGKLLERALHLHGCGKHESASFSAGAALEQADDCAAAQKLIYAHEDDLVSVLMAGLGEPDKIPELVVPLTDIPIDEIDNRAAFLLTRVDGSLSLEEILVVCGMPKLEALRHLSRMHSRSYLSLQ